MSDILSKLYSSHSRSIWLTTFLIIFLFYSTSLFAQSDWYVRESKHFKVIYRAPQANLVPHILQSAEQALNTLMKIFDYKPSEKIIINTYDVNDYGFASATTVPENFIRLEVEPFEPGYENVPYNERFQWVLSHELVHIVVDDKASNAEKITRSIFSKVSPEKSQPVSILFSLLTNYSRYTPRWHQEGIAVFMETWLSGGFGRELGNFDEMYFRSMVLNKNKFPSYNELDSKTSLTSFLLGTLYYIYGARFCAYLSIKYGADKLLDWFKVEPGDFYEGFVNKFKKVYGLSLTKGWNDFIQFEKNFQNENIKRIEKSLVTPIHQITRGPIGWVTEAYYDSSENSMIFGFHNPNHLAEIGKLKLTGSQIKKVGTLPTPSMFQVASTAFDKNLGLFFYTTKNNELYRDLRVLQLKSQDTKLLFENSRVGDLTVSNSNHEIWGVLHSDARTSLVYSAYPYRFLEPVIGFNVGDNIFDLSVSPSGHQLTAVLHRTNGVQSVIVANCDSLKAGKNFKFFTITDKGTPESPSWSSDGKYIYWNAYTNGVSNIYRKKINDPSSAVEPMSNTLSGLFKPVYLNKDSLFAFEFTPKGFIPVIIPNKPAEYLPAIQYMGEEIVNKDPEVTHWTTPKYNVADFKKGITKQKTYNSLANLKILTFIPVISGFREQKVFGFYSHISDPLIVNDLTMEFGVSLFNKNPQAPKYHLKAKYSYKRKYNVGIDYNAPDFYDLFNKRKRGMMGTKLSLGDVHYWIYDNPLKVKQTTEFDWYTGVEYFNDNLLKISIPDFWVAQTAINSKDLRRSIGSIDFEYGNNFTLTWMNFGSQDKKSVVAGQLFGEWDNYSTWLFPHNIFHLKVASGYSWNTNKLIQAKFYFGGFGNRIIEDADVKQYRNIFRLPGVPIYDISAANFGKVMIENELPPVRFSNARIGQHYLSHFNVSLYSQGLIVFSPKISNWVDAGAQINFVFRHWYNLESTFSAGIAKAWFGKSSSWEWFLSYKLLK